MLEFNTKGVDQINKKLAHVREGMDGSLVSEIANIASKEVNKWYTDKETWFDNPNSPTHGSGRKDTHWARTLARGWQAVGVSSDGFGVEFSPQGGGEGDPVGSLLTHIHGSTIRAKGGALTIPVIPAAHGLNVRQFEKVLGKPLFKPKGKSYLAYVAHGGEGITVAYLLRKSVTIPSLEERSGRKALPDAEDLEQPLNEAVEFALAQLIK